jgi:hypothetical protein
VKAAHIPHFHASHGARSQLYIFKYIPRSSLSLLSTWLQRCRGRISTFGAPFQVLSPNIRSVFPLSSSSSLASCRLAQSRFGCLTQQTLVRSAYLRINAPSHQTSTSKLHYPNIFHFHHRYPRKTSPTSPINFNNAWRQGKIFGRQVLGRQGRRS